MYSARTRWTPPVVRANVESVDSGLTLRGRDADRLLSVLEGVLLRYSWLKVDSLHIRGRSVSLSSSACAVVNSRRRGIGRTILPELEYMYNAPVPTVANIAAHAHSGAIPVAATLRACHAVGLTGLFIPGKFMVGCRRRER